MKKGKKRNTVTLTFGPKTWGVLLKVLEAQKQEIPGIDFNMTNVVGALFWDGLKRKVTDEPYHDQLPAEGLHK